jgi:hypothetical protein
MPGGIKVYDSNQVDVVFNGLTIDSGRADGTFVKIDWEADRFTDKAGADGETTRSKTNDKRATITLTLMQSSASNAALSALAALDDVAPNGAGVGPVLIKDRSGLSLYSAPASWIARSPDAEFAAEAGTREWKIRVSGLQAFDGGN